MTYDRLLMLNDESKGFTAKAAGDISGGFLVKFNSGVDALGSDVSTYAWDDISVSACDDTDNCVGIALDAAASGAEVAIAAAGIFILPAGSSAVSGGFAIESAGYDNMVITSLPAGEGSGLQRAPIGRALTNATALTGYALVRLNC